MQQVGVNQRLKQLQGSTTGCEAYFGPKLDSRTVFLHSVHFNQVVNLITSARNTRMREFLQILMWHLDLYLTVYMFFFFF